MSFKIFVLLHLFVRTLPYFSDFRTLKYELILNESKKWSEGSWIHDDNFIPLFTEHHFGHSICRTRLNRLNSTAYESSLKWIWVPNSHNTSYTIPRQQDFCHILNNRNILVVGDSLNWEFFDTIVDFSYNISCGASQFDRKPKQCLICQGNNKIMFIRNDILSTVLPKNVIPGIHPHSIVEYSWINYFLSGEYQIVVFNRGAHYVNNSALIDNLKVLNQYFNNTEIRNKITIFYRNTAIGHSNCESFTSPVKSFNISNDLLNSDYYWTKFNEQNQLVQEYYYNLGIYVIDAYSTSYFRPDSHMGDSDCLHYCIPGPIDTWMIFFYNLLKLDNLIQL